MTVHSFSSDEEMMQFMQTNRQAALADLHPAQAAIDLGHYWVQFYDLDTHPPHVIFGRVVTEAEILAEATTADPPVFNPPEAANRERGRQTETGLMYGIAYDYAELHGEWGYTHKVSVWPIEKRLFDMARAAGFNINGLDETGRVLLQLAFQGHRAHLRNMAGDDPHDPKPVTRDDVWSAIETADTSAKLDKSDVDLIADRVMALIERG